MSKWSLFWKLMPLFISLLFIGWVLWRWLRASDEPLI